LFYLAQILWEERCITCYIATGELVWKYF